MGARLPKETRERIDDWTRRLVTRMAENGSDPGAEGVGADLHRQCMEELDVQLSYATFRYTYFVPALEALAAKPSTNGSTPPATEATEDQATETQPEPPSGTPSAGDAEPEGEPATEPVEGAGQVEGVEHERRHMSSHEADRTFADGPLYTDAPEAETTVALESTPVNDAARTRLRTYARAFAHFTLVADADLDDPVRIRVRGAMYDLEEALIGDLTARAQDAEVERRAMELDQLADDLRQRTEGLLNALSRSAAGV